MDKKYSDLECLNNENLETSLQNWSKKNLIDYILELKENRAFKREDRLVLQILDGVHFTIWACDSQFRIRLWEGACEENYQITKKEALGKNYLKLFVDPVERRQSKIDCLEIINTGKPQSFRLCDDVNERGIPLSVITQCCKIKDDDNSPLQAEMAISVDYQKLKRESELFVAKEKKYSEEREKYREELLNGLENCRARLIEAADKRTAYFINMRDPDSGTNAFAINAARKIIPIRKQFTEYFNTMRERIKTTDCPCDTDTGYKGPHSFDCMYDNRREKLNIWRSNFEKKELVFHNMLAAVALEPDK